MSVENFKNLFEIALPEKLTVIMFDASENANGFVLLIGDYADEETGKTSKLASVAFGSKRFSTAQMSLKMYA